MYVFCPNGDGNCYCCCCWTLFYSLVSFELKGQKQLAEKKKMGCLWQSRKENWALSPGSLKGKIEQGSPGCCTLLTIKGRSRSFHISKRKMATTNATNVNKNKDKQVMRLKWDKDKYCFKTCNSPGEYVSVQWGNSPVYPHCGYCVIFVFRMKRKYISLQNEKRAVSYFSKQYVCINCFL